MAATTDIAARTREVVATIETPEFMRQVEESLPEGVSLQRFVSVAKTAVRTTPELVKADENSLFASIVKCAQDGLLPDGREAALVIFKGKVGYIRMIDGIRRIAAVYGWQIRTAVVYDNDDFDYTDEPPVISHRPVRPGGDRGQLLAAYAVATHRDGRRVQTVLHPDEIAKRRAVAQTDAVWKQWTPQMYEKTAGHDIFKQLSLDPADARVDRILREGILAEPLAALYGGAPSGESAGDHQQADAADAPGGAASAEQSAASAPGDDPDEAEVAEWVAVDDEPEPDEPTEEQVAEAAKSVVRGGLYDGQTFEAVAEQKPVWFVTQLKQVAEDAPGRPVIETFVRGRLPELWKTYTDWKAEQS